MPARGPPLWEMPGSDPTEADPRAQSRPTRARQAIDRGQSPRTPAAIRRRCIALPLRCEGFVRQQPGRARHSDAQTQTEGLRMLSHHARCSRLLRHTLLSGHHAQARPRPVPFLDPHLPRSAASACVLGVGRIVTELKAWPPHCFAIIAQIGLLTNLTAHSRQFQWTASTEIRPVPLLLRRGRIMISTSRLSAVRNSIKRSTEK